MKTAPPYLTHQLYRHYPGSHVSTWIRNRQWTLQPKNLTSGRSRKAWPGAFQTTQGSNQLWEPPHGKLIAPLQITSPPCQVSGGGWRLTLFWSKENVPSILKLPNQRIFANLIFILSATVWGTSVWRVPSYIVSSFLPPPPLWSLSFALGLPWNYLVPWPCSWSSSEEIVVFNLMCQRIPPDCPCVI